ncbi:flagellar biosynthesis protein FlhA [Afifella marina]|uniref:Flagellar biosynthesis protein FlhA n=1 Tax=Afifella marina DSM 2698 TaxID=1120955 RepID=A0A1G5MVD8_AFIMA|nr:flagellar biosynthesis protein FlhA [Afifella marina]MBK1622017.1 flagellar biosynthesis protein FlhA [Afifella marina DSM 2698]MBK1627810.1 flagellar biosynthesis protein FlhA [Afifella marina]MBK5916777.1 flagellar biosynthesis protein FlhA [Afifella marina]RAI19897.1 flagellar biosynthesis protein FlhA [Afifella marina DSM 2698]SCZ28804.1 flagellar biosynthesis protein FlhA [Afifella marina DSM 2698]
MSEMLLTAGDGLEKKSKRDIGFATLIIGMLVILFLPIPTFLIDFGLALSIAFSVLILMVALWIQKPLEFSSFPTVLLIATVLRLALGVATTRLILAHGNEGVTAAGNIINGFSMFVMGGDFVIGIVVFLILVTVNFLVITKGATRIAEVGARFTLDAIPGKQMAIDADLNAGLIDDKEAQLRRRELEEESSFFGSMDGASKFVRGEAIASLITIAVNIFGGIIIATTRYGMPLDEAADVFTRLSVGDGLVAQIPALVVSLAAGLLVSKGGTRGSAEKAVFGQLGAYPKALGVAAALMFIFALMPGLPLLPFGALGGFLAFVAYTIPRQQEAKRQEAETKEKKKKEAAEVEARNSVKESLRTCEIELCIGKQLATQILSNMPEIAHRVSRMRRKFAQQYGFVVPEIKLTESLNVPSKSYEIRIHGTVFATCEMRIGELLVVTGDNARPDVPGDTVREPAFGMQAMWISDAFATEVRREGYTPIDNLSVVLTHVSEVIRNNLAQLLSYKDVRMLLDRLEPEYKRLVDDICPSHITYSGLQAVLKLLLTERVSIRNLHLILEALAEIVPHARRSEQIAEHVRMRMAQQICGDLAQGGVLNVLRLGNRWDLAFHQSLKRDAKGEVIEFDIDPRLVEEFASEASEVLRARLAENESIVLVTAPEARIYVRMIIERMFPSLAVLSHLEIARGIEIKSLGSIS